MAVQEEGGWPLGLQPLNVRIGLARSADFSRSMSFSTLISGSPTSSTDSSSDLDTESTGSFFHDRSITLGSLMGITSILQLSSGSFSGRRRQDSLRRRKSIQRPRTSWFFSLCTRATVDGDTAATGKAPSLGHFLEVERRASGGHRRNRVPITYELDGVLLESQPVPEPNSLFSNGCIAPPPAPTQDGGGESSGWAGSSDKRHQRDSGHANGHGIPVRFSCMGGCSL
uniref:Uncharacterized protein At3g17950 n=1 Tax=Anthurium amnicola TaxID=1678845 RepID=A0A1D1YDP7_9ARAE